MKYQETILLVEPDHAAVRTVVVTQRNVKQVIERLHLNPKNPADVTLRTWTCTDDEKDQTGQLRVFREVLPEPPAAPAEKPVFDELTIKTPLRLTEHDRT